MVERWDDVVDYEDTYEVSSLGRVRSHKREVKDKNGRVRCYESKMLKPSIDGNGSCYVLLSRHGKVRQHKVHNLVAARFIGEIKSNQKVLFKDGNRANCRLTNLSYGKLNNREFACGETHGRAKLTHDETIMIRGLRDHLTQRDFASILKVSQTTVWQVLQDKTWLKAA